MFSAALRVEPAAFAAGVGGDGGSAVDTTAARKAFVRRMMDVVELGPLAGRTIGLGGAGGGLSTEARKRLTIAVELVANPSVVFMDEPTSGERAYVCVCVCVLYGICDHGVCGLTCGLVTCLCCLLACDGRGALLLLPVCLFLPDASVLKTATKSSCRRPGCARCGRGDARGAQHGGHRPHGGVHHPPAQPRDHGLL